MQRVSRKSERDAWFVAWALALALHTALFLAFRGVHVTGAPGRTRTPAPIRLVFKTTRPAQEKTRQRFFSELPPDRADDAPKSADLLSNVTSRARDRVLGGDAARPRMEGDADAPLVKLVPGSSPVLASPENASGPPREPGSTAASAIPQGNAPRAREPAVADGAGRSTPPPPKPEVGRRPGDQVPLGSIRLEGNSDIHQPEMANPDGNAPLMGDLSLNTIAWDYAPWLQRFGRQLMQRWVPPPAYLLGILKEGGWAVIEVEISRSGEILRLDLLEEQGHPSLIRAAQIAVRSMHPIERLPADFPEPTLILRIRMIYPKVRPR